MMNRNERGLALGAAIEGMALARLFETSNALISAAYIGKRAKSAGEALVALNAMAEMLETSGSACSPSASELRRLTSTATEATAVESCHNAAQHLSGRGTELIRIAIERRPERRNWWQFWS